MTAYRVLVVEDDPMIAEDLRLRLTLLDHVPTGIAGKQAEVLQQIRIAKPDLVLMDIDLGDSENDGITIAQIIYDNFQIPVIFLTAYFDEHLLERYRSLAMPDFGYLAKPVNNKNLQLGIELAMIRHQRALELRCNLEEQDRSIRALADSNVRMLLVSEAIHEFQESEAELYDRGEFTTIYRQMVEKVVDLMRVRYGALGLYDETGQLQEFIPVGLSEEEQAGIDHWPQGKGLLGSFYHEKQVVRVEDIAQHPDSCGFPEGHPPMHNLLGLPLMAHGQQLGVLYLADKKDGLAFNDGDEEVVELFAAHVANLIERNRLLERLRQEHQALLREKQEHQASIEELNKAQDQLLQSEKLASIGQLAAGVAHEINNPVGYINSNIGSLRRYLDDLFTLLATYDEADAVLQSSPEIYHRLQKIRQDIDIEFLKEDITDLMRESEEGVYRVKQIVQDLKDFSHVDEAEWQWADLHNGLDSTLNIVHNEIKYKADVIKEYGELPQVECVASQLNQVFMNMLVNAAHAIEERGTITVRTGLAGERVWVEIEDSGKGISKEDQKRIFEPFFTTKPVGKGTGLGLSLSYGIIQKHGGEIELESEPGKGTRFRIWLPVQQPEPMAEAGDYSARQSAN